MCASPSSFFMQYIGELDLKKRPVKRAYPYSVAWSSVKVGIGVGSLDKEAEDYGMAVPYTQKSIYTYVATSPLFRNQYRISKGRHPIMTGDQGQARFSCGRKTMETSSFFVSQFRSHGMSIENWREFERMYF